MQGQQADVHDQQDAEGSVRRDLVRVALIGEGIGTSLTPSMHRAEAAEHGIPYAYEIIDLLDRDRQPEDLEALLGRLRAEGYRGANVTHPFKQRVLSLLDRLSPAAAHIGAVNHVSFEADGSVVGHNTDWTGFRAGFLAELGANSRATVLQLGTGGAGAATAYALLDLGVQRLLLADQDPTRAASLAERYRPLFPGREIVVAPPDEVSARLARADGLVHATPVGMATHPGISGRSGPAAPGGLGRRGRLSPAADRAGGAARAAGHPVLDGGRMAVGQACDSLALFAGIVPDRDRMRRTFLALLRAEAQAGA